MELDPNLEQYATERQWEFYNKACELGSMRAAARHFGVRYFAVHSAITAIKTKAARAGYAPEHDMERTVPDGYYLKGTSTLYRRGEDEPVLQWVKSNVDHERQRALFMQMVEALSSELPRVPPTRPAKGSSGDLMACYPIGDHHLGMYAWGAEAGEDYDLEIGERLLNGAMDHLVESSPACDRAAVVFLGDFVHYDGMEPVTPTAKNQLDSDGRYAKMVEVAIRAMRYAIEAARRRHGTVDVIVEIGNHDLSSSIFLAHCLAAIYENEPRVRVDTSPRQFHYFSFGNCLVGVHHGHGAKMAQLPLIMATDEPELWGRTQYRYWWTGHVHKDSVLDAAGCRVESFRVLPPADAWAANQGYRPGRDMKSILLHKCHGEVARAVVRPEMLSSV